MGRTSSITMPSMVGIAGRAPAVDEKVWCFLFVCLFVCFFVTLWNYNDCDNGNAMKRCNFQNNYGVIAYGKVCSCAPIFNFFCGPPKFSHRGKFIPKNAIFRDFFFGGGAVAIFLKPEQLNLVWGCGPGTPSLKPNIFWANLYQKLPISAILGAVSPHFKSDNG